MATTPPKSLPVQHRALSFDRAAVDAEQRTVELAFSSEQPYERWWGVEILDHSPGAMRTERLTDGAPLLCNHEPEDQIGVVDQVMLGQDRIGRAKCRFSRNADAMEVFQDVVDGIKTKVSVGYVIHQMKLESETDGVPTYRVTDWEPFEISIVSIPADNSVGVGRAAEPGREFPVTLHRSQEMTTSVDTAPAQAAQAPQAGPTIQVVDNGAQRLAEVTAMVAAGEAYAKYDGVKIAGEAVRSGKSLAWFNEQILQRMESGATASQVKIGMTDSEVKRYSILRAIKAAAEGDWSKAGLEREVNDELIRRHGPTQETRGFRVPYDVQVARRDLTVGTASAGGNMVATNLEPGSFIDLLRNRTVVGQLGARYLSGLVGNVAIPRQTGAATAYWLANEGTSITESQQTIGQLGLTPKHVGAYTEVSRQLLMQATPDADMMVQDDLARVLAIGIDLAALAGTGSSGQPTGVINTAGIGAVTGTSLAYAGILEFQTDVASANALAANCAYVTTPSVAALLAQRQRFASTDSPLWMGNLLDGTVSGFRAVSTLQMATASMLFGDFSQIVIGEWGTLEIAVSPYANFQAAITGIRAIQTVDIGVRIAGAFSLATSIS